MHVLATDPRRSLLRSPARSLARLSRARLRACVRACRVCARAGHAYVGLSRATSLDGLCIHNISAKTIRANPKVKAFYRQV